MRCDWCHKPIDGDHAAGWAYEIHFEAFHCLTLGRKISGGPNGIALATHLHPKPCKDKLAWAIQDLLENHEPLETDGPAPADEPEPEGETAEETIRRMRREQIAAERAWRAIPKAERLRTLLEAVGADASGLTIAEAVEAMRAKLPDCSIYESHVRPLMTELFKAREVDRRPDPRKNGRRVRWLYFRRPDLEGDIADLERMLRDDAEGDR